MKTTTTTQAISEYDQQVIDFLQATNSTITIEYKKYGKHFVNDKEERDIYIVTLQRGKSKYTFDYGDSIMNTAKRIICLSKAYIANPYSSAEYHDLPQNVKDAVKNLHYFGRLTQHDFMNFIIDTKKEGYKKPSDYDILSCLEANNPYTFSDFCDNYGYDNDSMSAKNTYDKVVEQYLQLSSMYSSEELEKLNNIQ